MRSLTLAAIVALLLCSFVSSVAAEAPSLKERFEALSASKPGTQPTAENLAKIVELWRANEGKALLIIDSYLEGSLAIIEKAEKASDAGVEAKSDRVTVEQMHARALVGARAADAAFGRSMFSDYVSSFVGWTRAQQKQFRAGQGAFGEARKAAKAGDHAQAKAAAQRCIELAQPLGDWWGFAMGLSARGAAEQALGEHEKALASLSSARQIHAALGLRSSSYRNARAMATSLVELKRYPRAKVTIEAALSLARELKDEKGVAELTALQGKLK